MHANKLYCRLPVPSTYAPRFLKHFCSAAGAQLSADVLHPTGPQTGTFIWVFAASAITYEQTLTKTQMLTFTVSISKDRHSFVYIMYYLKLIELKSPCSVRSLYRLQARKIQRDLTDCICTVGAAISLRSFVNHKQGRPSSCLHTSPVKLSSMHSPSPRELQVAVPGPALQAAAQSQTS